MKVGRAWRYLLPPKLRAITFIHTHYSVLTTYLDLIRVYIDNASMPAELVMTHGFTFTGKSRYRS